MKATNTRLRLSQPLLNTSKITSELLHMWFWKWSQSGVSVPCSLSFPFAHLIPHTHTHPFLCSHICNAFPFPCHPPFYFCFKTVSLALRNFPLHHICSLNTLNFSIPYIHDSFQIILFHHSPPCYHVVLVSCWESPQGQGALHTQQDVCPT